MVHGDLTASGSCLMTFEDCHAERGQGLTEFSGPVLAERQGYCDTRLLYLSNVPGLVRTCDDSRRCHSCPPVSRCVHRGHAQLIRPVFGRQQKNAAGKLHRLGIRGNHPAEGTADLRRRPGFSIFRCKIDSSDLGCKLKKRFCFLPACQEKLGSYSVAR